MALFLTFLIFTVKGCLPSVSSSSHDQWWCVFFLDINECSASPSVCDSNANCQNTKGSYLCSCNVGFNGDGRTCKGKIGSNKWNGMSSLLCTIKEVEKSSKECGKCVVSRDIFTLLLYFYSPFGLRMHTHAHEPSHQSAWGRGEVKASLPPVSSLSHNMRRYVSLS